MNTNRTYGIEGSDDLEPTDRGPGLSLVEIVYR